jgi:predicted Co/Zn/Cd cation transporter (cation efflux family)
LQSPLREDFFDVLMKLPAEEAARTLDEWQAVRRKAGKSLQLR